MKGASGEGVRVGRVGIEGKKCVGRGERMKKRYYHHHQGLLQSSETSYR